MADNIPTAGGDSVHQGCTEAYQKLRRKSEEWERYARKLKVQRAEVEKSLHRQVQELQEQVAELQGQVRRFKGKEEDIREADQVRAEHTVEIANVNTAQPPENESANRSDSTPPNETSAPRSRTLNPRFGKLNIATTQRALANQPEAFGSNASKAGSPDLYPHEPGQADTVGSGTSSAGSIGRDTGTALLQVCFIYSVLGVDCADRTGTS